jgi:hypothetical protein
MDVVIMHDTSPSTALVSQAASEPTSFHIALAHEFHPVGVSENLLVQEIARRAAQLHTLDLMLATVEQQAASALAVIAPDSAHGDETEQIILGRLAAQESVAAIYKQSLGNSKAMIRALHELQSAVGTRHSRNDAVAKFDPRFADEAACCIFLLHRYRQGEVGCRRCGRTRIGSWIPTRRCWQCAECKTQTCIRNGTVMANSHLPLTTWFNAIRLLLLQPSLTSRDLERYLNVRRAATIRSIKARISSAIASDRASELLAGLDRVYLPGS